MKLLNESSRPLIVGVLALFGVAAIAQVANPAKYIPATVAGKPAWFTLGPTLSVSSTGQLDAIVPPAPVQKQRVRDIPLQYQAAAGTTPAGWVLPAGATAIEVYVNGIRYHANIHFRVEAGRIVPATGVTLLPEYTVVLDYDQL